MHRAWNKGSGSGVYISTDGYLRICRRGPDRNKMAHRAYVERQVGRPLRPDEEVHHLCRNRQCWPPTDFHLLLLDAALHEAFEAGAAPQRHRKRNNQVDISGNPAYKSGQEDIP